MSRFDRSHILSTIHSIILRFYFPETFSPEGLCRSCHAYLFCGNWASFYQICWHGARLWSTCKLPENCETFQTIVFCNVLLSANAEASAVPKTLSTRNAYIFAGFLFSQIFYEVCVAPFFPRISVVFCWPGSCGPERGPDPTKTSGSPHKETLPTQVQRSSGSGIKGLRGSGVKGSRGSGV